MPSEVECRSIVVLRPQPSNFSATSTVKTASKRSLT
jgi:hypothetical protein